MTIQLQTASTVPTQLEAALEYAQRAIPVFPCNPLDKKPLTKNGFKDATTDEQQIRAWWGQWPNALIGMPTGPRSGTWVLDVDVDSAKGTDGTIALAKLIAQHGVLPPTLTSITPRTGRHFLFTWDSAVEIRNSTSKVGPGIDVRGDGGYICLPPSPRADGVRYQWDPAGGSPACCCSAMADRTGAH